MFCISVLLTVFPLNVSCVARAELLIGNGSILTPTPKPESVIPFTVLELDAIVSPQPELLGQSPLAVNVAEFFRVTSGLPSPLMSPLIVTPPPLSGGS